MLASSIDFEIELQPVAFVQLAQARTFDRADVHKGIGLAVITGDEAKALHRVEELDGAGGLFAGQLALRRGGLCRGRDHIADNLQIGRGNLAAAINQVEFQRLTFGQTFKAGTLDRADVDEHVFAAIFALNEAEALLGIEEFDDALTLANDLSRHAASTAAAGATRAAEAATITAAKTATTAATAKAITATAKAITATAKAITATAETISTAEPVSTAAKRIETLFAKSVALVSAPAATPSIKTHKPERTFASPHCSSRCDVDDSCGAAGQATAGPFPLHPDIYTNSSAIANRIICTRPAPIVYVTFLPMAVHRGLVPARLIRPRFRRMSMFIKLSDSVWVAPQITVADVAQAAAQGITLIVNNRPEDESPDQTPGEDIAAAAAAAGLAYVAIPVGHSGFSEPQIIALGKALDEAPGPVLAYCRSGTRSTLLWSLTQASRGHSPEAIASQAAKAGYDISPVRPLVDMLAAKAG